MFDEQDQELGPVLTLVIGIAIVISLLSITMALSVSGRFSAPASDTGQAPAASIESTAPVGVAIPSLVKIYFVPGSNTLPADALDSLQQLADAAKVDPGRRIEVSRYHDASGDPERNLVFAKARAFAVRDALAAATAGIPQDRIELRKPTEVLGSGDAQAARRVDVGLH